MKIHVIYDGGSIKEFESRENAYSFMDEMEDAFGYSFEYKGAPFGIDTYRDANHINEVIRFK